MKSIKRQNLIILIIVFEVAFFVAAEKGDATHIPLYPTALTVTQRLDHFNKSDTRLWEQRYFISGEHYEENGPVFVLVGDDTTASSSWLTDGYQWTQWADKYHALCFYVEQRFYGQSQPTEDMSLDSLKYFTLDQALEDLVEFRTVIEHQYKLNNKQWIFFGGEIGGLLATNLRVKHPNLVDGVVTSCSMMNFKVDNSDLLYAAFKILDKINPTCVPAITAAVEQIEDYFDDGPDGWANLSQKFQVCEELNGNDNKQVEDFYFLLAKQIYKIVAGSDVFESMTNELLCDIMNNSMKAAEIDRLALVIELSFTAKNSKCNFVTYEKFVQLMKDSMQSFPITEPMKSWYRTCTEIGDFIGSRDQEMPFHSTFSVSTLLERCVDIFGPRFDSDFVTSAVNATNKKFGFGAIDDQMSNILFISGSNDPEKPSHVLLDVNSGAKAIVIEGESHCTDMYPDTVYDSAALIKARLAIEREIAMWISS